MKLTELSASTIYDGRVNVHTTFVRDILSVMKAPERCLVLEHATSGASAPSHTRWSVTMYWRASIMVLVLEATGETILGGIVTAYSLAERLGVLLGSNVVPWP